MHWFLGIFGTAGVGVGWFGSQKLALSLFACVPAGHGPGWHL